MKLPRRGVLPALLLAAALLPGDVPGQDKSVRPGINDPFKDPNVQEFLGKFEKESREIWSQRAEIVAACKLKPGMVVADVGAGTGLFTRLFSPAVGDKGRVYAVDIAPPFIKHIEKTCAEQKLANVVGVVCKPDSVELPADSVDVVFVCDTYHHFEFPHRTMRSIYRALRPGGQLVLIDFHRVPGKSSEWTLNHVRAGQEVFTKEIVDSGFKAVGEEKFLKDNYFVRFEKVGDDRPKGEVKTFPYKKTKQAELALHVHYPPGWKKEDKRPAVVFFFGGGWTNGSVKQFEPQATYLAGRGLVTVRADYRIKSKHDVTPAECVEDAKSAVRWVRQNAGTLGVDPDRLVAAGGSAGGHIAACTALGQGLEAEGEDHKVSSRPNALLLYNPVLRFDGVKELMQRVGNKEELGKAISPTLHLAKGSPPTLLFYGKEDRLLAQGEEFLARSKELGHRAEIYLADGVGHGFFNRPPWLDRTTYRADEFLASLDYLTGKPTIQPPKEEQKVFRAGAFAMDITPKKYPISVNGGMQDRQAKGAHDPLHARCLVLDDGKSKLAVVVSDSCMIPRELLDEAKRRASKVTGIPAERMLISATHTHTAPTVGGVFQSDPDKGYQQYLIERIAGGIEMAHAKLAPAKVGWGVGSDPTQVFNRRWKMTEGTIAPDPFGRTTDKVKMNPGYQAKGLLEPAGPTDPDVSVLSVQTRDGKPVALLANYSLHYVGGVQPLSADYFGAFAEQIGRLLKADASFVGILSNGTSGDINNINYGATAPGKQAEYERIRVVADSVAKAAFAAHQKIEHRDWVPLAMAETEIELGVRLPSKEDVARAEEVIAKAKDGLLKTLPEVYARETVLLAKYPAAVKAKLQALRVGDLGVTAIPCEVFVEIGLEIKKQSPLKPTFTIELANGYNGYLPTPEQHKLGGYETWRARSSYLEADASTKITKAVLKLLDKVAK